MKITIEDDDGLVVDRVIDGMLLKLVIDEQGWLVNEFKGMLRQRATARAEARDDIPRETEDERGR